MSTTTADAGWNGAAVVDLPTGGRVAGSERATGVDHDGMTEQRTERPAPFEPTVSPAAIEQPAEHATEHPGDRDRGIRGLTTFFVLFVAGIAAIVSFLHIQALAITYGQGTLASVLTPLSIDGVVIVASLALLRAARHGITAPFLARLMLVLAVAATLAANIGYGVPHGVPGALISGWPAVAFIGSVEIAVGMVRRLSRPEAGTPEEGTPEPSAPMPRVRAVPPPERGEHSSAPPAPAVPALASTRQLARKNVRSNGARGNAPRARNGRPLARPIIERAVKEAGGVDQVNARQLAREHGLGASTVRRHLQEIREAGTEQSSQAGAP